MEEDRAEVLRRRIAFYRRRLQEGVAGDVARIYLLELGAAELELAEIEASERKARSRVRGWSEVQVAAQALLPVPRSEKPCGVVQPSNWATAASKHLAQRLLSGQQAH